MIDFKQFEIYYKGLSLGDHQFQFEIGKKFFERFKYTEIGECQIQVNLDLHKEKRLLTFEFEITGQVDLQCDRCLDEFTYPLDTVEILLVKFGEETQELDDDILVLSENEHMLDVSQIIYEYILLNLPMRRVHPDVDSEPACDKSVTNFIKEDIKQVESVDPAWEALKKLKNTNN